MTTKQGAPAALQPDDRSTAARWAALLDEAGTFWQDNQPAYYEDDAPQLDADADARRAGDWLGRRVLHEPSREIGVIVGRDPRGLWWVRIQLFPRGPASVVLMRSATLVQVTPELEAVITAERQLALEAEERAENNKRRFSKHVTSLRAKRDPNVPSRKGVYPPDHDGLRYCGRCHEWLPVTEFRVERGYGPRRVCRACAKVDSQKAHERRRAARKARAGLCPGA